jgi:hypothetical protein
LLTMCSPALPQESKVTELRATLEGLGIDSTSKPAHARSIQLPPPL